jgi:hypothetical protein
VRIEVPLVRIRNRTIVSGQLVSLTTEHIADFKTIWRGQLRNSAEADAHWDWEQKSRIYLSGSIDLYEGYAIEFESVTQGLMILQTGGYRSWADSNRRLVYVHSLATAPWNRLARPDPNGFRAVGESFLRFSRFRSEVLGFGGLVGVHSLLGAEDFYRKMGMRDWGIDRGKDDLRYFEWYEPRLSLMERYEADVGAGE